MASYPNEGQPLIGQTEGWFIIYSYNALGAGHQDNKMAKANEPHTSRTYNQQHR